MKSFLFYFALFIGGIFSLTSASVAHSKSSDYHYKVNPKIYVYLSCPALRKDRRATPADKAVAPISIRFRSPPSKKALQGLQASGVRFLFDGSDDHVMHLGLFFPARSAKHSLAALERSALVEQVDLDALILGAHPLDMTAKETQALEVWSTTQQGASLTGRGMKLGTIDTGIDVFHPAFFFADGGLFPWIDTNNNGQFDPGIDAVDINKNGKADANETLLSLDAKVIDEYTGEAILNSDNGKFDSDTDWLFADLNSNGQRDYGQKSGFNDSSPSFGEPLFVAEDLNHNGKLDLEEQLVALKTSKVKAVRLKEEVRERGKNLTSLVPVETDYHGTGATGIVACGQRGYHKRVGIAPDAEILIATTGYDTDYQAATYTAKINWLLQMKADVILHEYTSWTGEHLDGSSNHEGVLDQASKLGTPQITPAGNLGGTDKHMQTTLAAATSQTVTINVPGPSTAGTHYFMNLTLLWRDPSTNLEFTLQDPAGHQANLPTNNTSGLPWGYNDTNYFSYRADSSRGTAMMNIMLLAGNYPSAPGQLLSGNWKVIVKHPGATGSVLLLGYVTDAITSWENGIGFTENVSGDGLVCWPATADSGITVAAYAGHTGPPYDPPGASEKSGELRLYSSGGMRIDGVQIMDVAAPDNPVTPINFITSYFPYGSYILFGGTSGAGPHVAGAALLLKQNQPNLDSAGVTSAIQKGALVDVQVGQVPSARWGYGKLRIYRSIYKKDPPPNTPPTVSILAPEKIYANTQVTLQPEVNDNEDKTGMLQIRWDDNYDGTFESDFGPPSPLSKTYTKEGIYRLKLEVKDSGGLTSAAALLIHVLPGGPSPDAGTNDLDSGITAGDNVTEHASSGCSCQVSSAISLRAEGRSVFGVFLILGLAFYGARRKLIHK